MKFNFTILLFSMISFISCINLGQKKDPNAGFLIYEEFDANTRGWIEERSSKHYLGIENGYYYMHNKDSNSTLTSTRSLDKSYLYNLPRRYSIETSIDFEESEADTAFCGLLLEGSGYDYNFRINEYGNVEVTYYDYAKQETFEFLDIATIDCKGTLKKIKMIIIIDGYTCRLEINDQEIMNGTLDSRSWQRICPYTGTLTSIKVDYLIMDGLYQEVPTSD